MNKKGHAFEAFFMFSNEKHVFEAFFICTKGKIVEMGIFLGGGCRTFFKIVNILTYTCPNHSGVGVIDSPDRFEHVLHSYCIHQVLEKNFRHEIFIVRPQKMPKNGLFWRF